jgi:hypothetical protein
MRQPAASLTSGVVGEKNHEEQEEKVSLWCILMDDSGALEQSIWQNQTQKIMS